MWPNRQTSTQAITHSSTGTGLDRISQSERALKALMLSMLCGLLALLVYAIGSTTWARSLNSFGIGVAVAAAAVIIGGLFGFLFGIPKASQQAVPASPDAASPTGGSAAAGGPQRGWEYQPNTNLEQISDWLTKILVGVGLVQIRPIGDKLFAVAGGVASALRDPGTNRSFALALILFYAVVGFLLGYLWTRLYLPGAFRDADLVELAEMKSIVAQADLRSRDAQATSLGTGKGEPENVVKKLLAAAELATPSDPRDPWKGVFGGTNRGNDRELLAEVDPVSTSSGVYSVRLTVRSIHPETRPLKGAVQFFLHPTFRNDKPVITVGPNGVAELNLKAWGAFTVGAVADDGQTKLELDLSELETAPEEFRKR